MAALLVTDDGRHLISGRLEEKAYVSSRPFLNRFQPARSVRGVLLSFAVVAGLGLLGVAGLLAIENSLYLPAASTHVYWFISRSSGIVAYVLITASVLWGLVQSGGLFPPTRRTPAGLGPAQLFELAGAGAGSAARGHSAGRQLHAL